jgi:hypothetical protein
MANPQVRPAWNTLAGNVKTAYPQAPGDFLKTSFSKP